MPFEVKQQLARGEDEVGDAPQACSDSGRQRRLLLQRGCEDSNGMV